MFLFLQRVGLVLSVIVIGTGIDYLTHSLDERFYVPPEYFTNKILFGVFWGLVGFFILRKFLKHPTSLAVGVSLFVAIVLQTKYFLEGYAIWFVFLFMFLHFLMFLVPAMPIFRRFRSLL